VRLVAALVLIPSLAPLQCPSQRQPELAREESPAEALWQLSERFAIQGDGAARTSTLRFLIERYPSSRFAERARLALADAGTVP
jgi:hypothetical protein